MSTAPDASGPHQKSAGESSLNRPKRILIVDDEEGLRALCATYLQRRGYGVGTAADGVAAWNELNAATEPYDLLITDNEMPLEGGARLIERVRAAKMRIRILSISGFRTPAKMQSAEALCDALLPKPFTIQELGAAVAAQFGA